MVIKMKNNLLRQTLEEIPNMEIIKASELYINKINGLMGEAAYYKALERLVKEHYLEKIAKGIYTKPEKSSYGLLLPTEENIVVEYTERGRGLVVGYRMYNELNISTQIAKSTKIYSKAINQATKTIGNVKIEKHLNDYNNETCAAISMFEILKNYYTIQEFNYNGFLELIKKFVENYKESVVNYVIDNYKYPKSSIAFLRNILNHFGVENKLDIHLSELSKYQYPTMEEIYELARI